MSCIWLLLLPPLSLGCAVAGSFSHIDHSQQYGTWQMPHSLSAYPKRLCLRDFLSMWCLRLQLRVHHGPSKGAPVRSQPRLHGQKYWNLEWSIRNDCLSNITSWSRRKGIKNTTLPFIPERIMTDQSKDYGSHIPPTSEIPCIHKQTLETWLLVHEQSHVVCIMLSALCCLLLAPL